MRTFSRINQFKRDYKRAGRGKHRAILDKLLTGVITHLVSDATSRKRIGRQIGWKAGQVNIVLSLLKPEPTLWATVDRPTITNKSAPNCRYRESS